MADAPELDLPARKTALRAELRRRRLALSPRYRRQAALALAVPLIQMAVRLHNEMATFAEAGVSGAA